MYTDDSDPVAAAIHSGFIRGEWGEDVDVSMLDLEIKEQHQHAPHLTNGTTKDGLSINGNSTTANGTTPSTSSGTKSDTTKTQSNNSSPDEPPPQPQPTDHGTKSTKRMPPIPPPDKDLHITVLVLPTLEHYQSSVMYGIKSRPWGGNHDGMSFKVEKIDWVDEGASKGEERGGAARRKRLKKLMDTGRICTPNGLKGKRGVELHLRHDVAEPPTESKEGENGVNDGEIKAEAEPETKADDVKADDGDAAVDTAEEPATTTTAATTEAVGSTTPPPATAANPTSNGDETKDVVMSES